MELRLFLTARGAKVKEKSGQRSRQRWAILTYSKLKVWDAGGKVLPSRMEVDVK